MSCLLKQKENPNQNEGLIVPFLCHRGVLTPLNVTGLLVSISQQLSLIDSTVYSTHPEVFNPLENIPLPEQWVLDGKVACSSEGFGFYRSL